MIYFVSKLECFPFFGPKLTQKISRCLYLRIPFAIVFEMNSTSWRCVIDWHSLVFFLSLVWRWSWFKSERGVCYFLSCTKTCYYTAQEINNNKTWSTDVYGGKFSFFAFGSKTKPWGSNLKNYNLLDISFVFWISNFGFALLFWSVKRSPCNQKMWKFDPRLCQLNLWVAQLV